MKSSETWRRLLVRSELCKHSTSGSPVTGDAEDDEGEGSRNKAETHVLSGLERFDAAMKMLAETIQDQTQLKAAFNMWLEVEPCHVYRAA